jgi:hypothetical protein
MSGAVTLLNNASATGASVLWTGGRGYFSVVGTFGGASVSLQVLGPDSATWLDVGTSTTVTAAGGVVFDLPDGQIRATVTGGTPSGLYARAARVDR